MVYDPANGQTFIERTVKARKSQFTSEDMRALWQSVRPSATGAPSLQDMAMRKAISEISQDRSSATSEVFTGLPWPLACRMWPEIERLPHAELPVLSRFTLWRAFAVAYPDEQIFQYHKASELRPLFDVAEYIDIMHSTTCAWLTCLTLDLSTLSTKDLMRLPTMRNLVALDISKNSVGEDSVNFEDSMLRNWGPQRA